MGLGVGGRFAQENKHFGDMSDVLFTLFGKGLRQVVIAVRQAQPALGKRERID